MFAVASIDFLLACPWLAVCLAVALGLLFVLAVGLGVLSVLALCLDRRRLEGPHGHPLVIWSPSLWAVPAGTRMEGLV